MRPIDAYKVARAVVRVLRDSGRTMEILRVAELTGQGRYRDILRQHGEQPDMQRLMRERPEIDPAVVDYDGLRALPADTLGGRYARHLDDNNLTLLPNGTATRFTDDPDVAYLIRRARQSHDVWHALLDLGTSGHEEVLVHAFTWGQLRLPVSAMVVFFGCIKHMVLEQRWRALRSGLLAFYRRGRDAELLLPVVWEDMWSAPIEDVRRRYNVFPVDAADIHH